MSEEKDSYNCGFATGRIWEHPWYPGGPHVYRASSYERDKDWIAKCEQSAKNHEAWHKGFRDAYAIRLGEEPALAGDTA